MSMPPLSSHTPQYARNAHNSQLPQAPQSLPIIYGRFHPNDHINNLLVANNRWGSDSDIFCMSSKGQGQYDDFSADSIDRVERSQAAAAASRLYEETALSNLMYRNASFNENFLHPFYQNNYHNNDDYNSHYDIYDDDQRIYGKSKILKKPNHHHHHHHHRHQKMSKKSDPQLFDDEDAYYKLRRTASNESFFGIPVEVRPSSTKKKSSKKKENSSIDKKKSNNNVQKTKSTTQLYDRKPNNDRSLYAKRGDQQMMKDTRLRPSEEDSYYSYTKSKPFRKYSRAVYS